MDEKSLIKKYQSEIRQLKEELDLLKKGILSGTPSINTTEDNVILWKQKLEDGNVKLQSRLEQEEAAKAALLARIQRLTKLILVSTKATPIPRLSQRPGPRRRHSFCEDELSYLPHRRRDFMCDGESNDLVVLSEGFDEKAEVASKGEKKNSKGFLNWFKLRKHDGGSAAVTDGDQSSLRKAFTAPSTPSGNEISFLSEQGVANPLLAENVPADLLRVDREEFHSNSLPEEAPLISRKVTDVDLSREQLKILSGEVALHTSVLKRLTEEAGRSTMNVHIEMEMKKVNDEIKGKQQQIAYLEGQIKWKLDQLERPMSHAELLEQLNEKALELEVKTADNRIMQDQLKQKESKCQELKETVAQLKEELSRALEANELLSEGIIFQQNTDISHQIFHEGNDELRQKVQQLEIDELKQRLSELTEAKAQLEARNQKLLEESTYAKALASDAGAELKALSGEVTKLMNHNERLASELASARSSIQRRISNGPRVARRDNRIKQHEPALEIMLMEKDQREAELRKQIEESKQKEAFLEGELANMWVLVAKLRKAQGIDQDDMDAKFDGS